MTHRITIALDEGAVSRLKKLATLWQTSQAEVIRRSLEMAERAHAQSPDTERRIEAARQLRSRLKSRKIDVEEWLRVVRDARR